MAATLVTRTKQVTVWFRCTNCGETKAGREESRRVPAVCIDCVTDERYTLGHGMRMAETTWVRIPNRR